MAENGDLVAAVGRQVGYDLAQVDDEDALAVVESMRSLADALKCDVGEVKAAFCDVCRDRDGLNYYIDLTQMEEEEEVDKRGVKPWATAASIKRMWLKELRADRFRNVRTFFDELQRRYPDLPQVMKQVGDYKFDQIVEHIYYTDTSVQSLEKAVRYIADSQRITDEQRKLFICYRVLADYDFPEFFSVFKDYITKEIEKGIKEGIDYDTNDNKACNAIFVERINTQVMPNLDDELLASVMAMDKNGADLFLMQLIAKIYLDQVNRLAVLRAGKQIKERGTLCDPRLSALFTLSTDSLQDDEGNALCDPRFAALLSLSAEGRPSDDE